MNPSARLYLLPGLGADSRIYNRLDCGDGVEVIALDWIPVGGAKNLGDYAKALHEHYALEPPYFLGGVSLGGMIAQEWARLSPPLGLVLISTAVTRDEMAPLIRMAASAGIGPALRKPLLKAAAIVGDRFTLKTPEGRALFLDMLEKSDPDFMHFGARAVLDWQPPGVEVPHFRIHGTADRIFSAESTDNIALIKGGNHFMIFERAEEIGKEIGRFLEGE